MSRIDPECFPVVDYGDQRVCTDCFDDCDLRARIEASAEPGYCDYCEEDRDATAFMGQIAEFIGARMATFYGKAVDQLPYETREGGYMARHEHTGECLFGSIGLGIEAARHDALMQDVIDEIGDDAWCDFDWLALEIHESLMGAWRTFCDVVKTDRRFFFHQIGEDGLHPDERSIFGFLHEMAGVIESNTLIKTLPTGTPIFRARARTLPQQFTLAAELGPPPAQLATQSNRMNPPGIPMFYASDNLALAQAETRGAHASIGEFQTLKPLRILDLHGLDDVPGIFSECTRERRQQLIFLHDLSRRFAEPVPQNDRINIDYVPTQIVTEFLRDFDFEGGKIDGVKFTTSLNLAGANIVLFATNTDVIDTPPPAEHSAWLQLLSVTQI